MFPFKYRVSLLRLLAIIIYPICAVYEAFARHLVNYRHAKEKERESLPDKCVRVRVRVPACPFGNPVLSSVVLCLLPYSGSGTACCSVWHRLTTCHRVSSGCRFVSFLGISLAAFLRFYDSSKYFWLPFLPSSLLCEAKEDGLAGHLNSAVNPCLRSGRNICCTLK